MTTIVAGNWQTPTDGRRAGCRCSWCMSGAAEAGAYAFGMIGFALAAPAATERAFRMIESCDVRAFRSGWLAEDVREGRTWKYGQLHRMRDDEENES